MSDEKVQLKKCCMVLKRNRSMLENDSRVLREARTLVDEGYRVTILIWDSENKEDFIIEGTIVKTIPIRSLFNLDRYNSFSHQSLSKKRMNFFDLILWRIFSIIYKRIYQINTLNEALRLNCDIYHCHDFETLKIGYLIKKHTAAKVVYDAHELWSQGRTYVSHNRLSNSFYSLLRGLNILKERKWLKSVDLFITVNKSISNYFSESYNIEKPVVVRNMPHRNMNTFKKGRAILREELNIDKDKKIVLYQGGLVSGRSIENLIKAFETVEDSIVLVFLGYGPMNEYIYKFMKSNNNIYLKNAVAPADLLDFTKDADLGVSLMENICLSYYYSSPNKVWEYIGAGVPILTSDFPEMRALALDEGLGYIVNPDSPDVISAKINSIFSQENYEDYATRKNTCVTKGSQFTWENERNILISSYKNM